MDVLIVDDDPTVRQLFSRLLERAGFMVKAVDNGLAAFAELQRHKFRVIVSDLQMPFLKGTSFYEELAKEMPDMAKRVVFVTGWAGNPDTQEALDKAGRPVLKKPADPKELLKVVRQIAGSPP